MSKKFKLLLYIFLFSGILLMIDTDLDVVASDINYAKNSVESGVSFIKVSSNSGTVYDISNDGHGIDLGNILLSKLGDREEITYELKNGKYFSDVDVQVSVKSDSKLMDEYFIIDCSDVGYIKKGNTKSGTISIELRKTAIEDVSIPLNITINVSPVYKKNRLLNFN